MELLQNCRDHAHKYYGDLMLAAEKTLENALFEQAEKCPNNEDQRRYFEAMQQLKARGGAMQATFRQELSKGYQAFASGQDEETSLDDHIDLSNLSLVQRNDLEDELAISVIVSKSNSRNSESLWKLNRRMAVIRGGKNVSDETNPFGPAMVCQALQIGIAQLSIDSKAKILIYKHLGKILVISFAKVLDGLNEILMDKGILPNLRFSVAKAAGNDVQAATSADKASTEQLASFRETTSSIIHQQELYSAIRALQSHTGPRTHTAGGVSLGNLATDGSGGADTFSAMDYALTLSAIQQSRAFLSSAALNQPLPAELVEEKLLGQLSQQANKDSHHKMTQDDADTVDLVGMIFRYMLDDPELHDGVKSLLSHLHTPYLKLALVDKSFLNNYQHNARLLLNSMAEVGGKWVREDNDRTVLPKIKMIVEQILNGFIDDITIFDRLLEDFSRFREHLAKRSRMVEKRNTESQQGLEKLELSKQRAIDEIEARLEHANIPEMIADLLRKPWADFIAFNLLRHGDKSLTWQSALKVVDGVVWSVRPGEASDSKEDLHRRQADLEQTVSEGLMTIGYDSEASKGLLNSLKEAQELVYHGAVMDEVNESNALAKAAKQGETSVAVTVKKPSTTAQAALNSKPNAKKPLKKTIPPPLSSEEQGIVEKLQEIAFGTWFEFDQEKTVTQLKLAWFSRVSSHYMFVDHAGVKQAVETQASLAKGMCAGSIRVVELTQKSFMERALETVLDKLKLMA
ncbi:MAG: DUF1631 domain-containing protein [Pseudomonadales bacterium]